jgi:hypothetical protein
MSVDLWHRRFGHLSPTLLSKIKRTSCVKGVSLPAGDLSSSIGVNGVCEPCIEGKMTTAPYKPTGSVVSQKLELVHMDVMGPMKVPTPEGEQYVLNVLDEFSNFCASVLMKRKGDASKEGILVLKTLSLHTEFKVKTIRTDGGTEFLGLDGYCRKHGILHQVTPPYSHQSNGKVERLNRTLQEKAMAMLSDSQLPTKYWGEAMLMASHVQNISPTTLSDKTPFELMYGVVPDASHLRVFGSKCKGLTPKTLRSGKFNPICQSGIFVGYQGVVTQYRVLINGKVSVCRGANCKCIEEVDHVSHHTPTLHSDHSVPSHLCVTGDEEEDGGVSDDDPDPDYIPDVFDTCSEDNMPGGADLEAEEEEHQDPFPCEASGGDKGGAGYGDHGDPSCYTSPLGARPTYVGVPQVPSHNSVGDIASNPRMEEEIEYD